MLLRFQPNLLLGLPSYERFYLEITLIFNYLTGLHNFENMTFGPMNHTSLILAAVGRRPQHVSQAVLSTVYKL